MANSDEQALPSARYTRVAIFMHWLIAMMIIGQIAGGLIMVKVLPRTSSLTFELYQLHKSFGMMILVLSVLRLIWRLTHRPPALPVTMKGWEQHAASITHILFYGAMIGIPLIGWAMVSVSPLNIPTFLFDVVQLPHLPFFEGVENKKAMENLLKWLHEYAAFATIGLLVLHIGAALKHHFVEKDMVLARMIPFIRRRA